MPRNFFAEAANSTSISLSWTRPATPNGVITHYTLTYSTNGGDESMEMVPPTLTSFPVDNLNEYTMYTFTLSASTIAGTGPSATASAITDEDGKIITCN